MTIFLILHCFSLDLDLVPLMVVSSFWQSGQKWLPNVGSSRGVMGAILLQWATSSFSMKNTTTSKEAQISKINARDSKLLPKLYAFIWIWPRKRAQTTDNLGKNGIKGPSRIVLCKSWEENQELVTNQRSMLGCSMPTYLEFHGHFPSLGIFQVKYNPSIVCWHGVHRHRTMEWNLGSHTK